MLTFQVIGAFLSRQTKCSRLISVQYHHVTPAPPKTTKTLRPFKISYNSSTCRDFLDAREKKNPVGDSTECKSYGTVDDSVRLMEEAST